MQIGITEAKTTKLKEKLNFSNFGEITTDHMFIAKYSNERGWYDLNILPYGPISLDPTALVFHYAQSIFEGLKIFRQVNGDIAIFRPSENAKRFNYSAIKMGMPIVPEDLFLESIKQLSIIDSKWIPSTRGYSLYARPVMIATEASLGVKASKEYLFYIILTPVQPYYVIGDKGFKLIALKNNFRSSEGDVSDAKTAGNYGKTIRLLEEIKSQGYNNILWLEENKLYIEEAGITNVFILYKNKEIYTPPLNKRILSGITRKTIIDLLKQKKMTVYEKEISISSLCKDIKNNLVEEIFISGTATLIAPVDSLTYDNEEYKMNPNKREFTELLYKEILDIQHGNAYDINNWMMKVES